MLTPFKLNSRYASAAVLAIAPHAFAQLPPIVILSNNQESTIWAPDRSGAPAKNGSVTLQSVTGAGTATASVNPTGSAVTTHTNTVAQPGVIVTQAALPCEAVTRNWTGAGATCTAPVPRMFTGQVANAVDSNPADGGSGAAGFTCQHGVWNLNAGSTCVPPPAPPPPPPPPPPLAVATSTAAAWSYCSDHPVVYAYPSGGVAPYSYYWYGLSEAIIMGHPSGANAYNYMWTSSTLNGVRVSSKWEGNQTLVIRITDAVGSVAYRNVTVSWTSCA